MKTKDTWGRNQKPVPVIRPFQRLHPLEEHPWLFARTAQRGRPLCRPHERKYRDSQGRVAETPGAREGPQERVPAHEAHPAGCIREQGRSQEVPLCATLCTCGPIHPDDCGCHEGE